MKTIILVGGGHAHLHCLQQLHKEKPSGWNVVLISPSAFQYYSGMFSAFTEGIYGLDDIRVDLFQLAKSVNAEFIKDAIIKIDPDTKELWSSNGKRYAYDVVSFDIGSQVDIPAAYEHLLINIKPNFNFPENIRLFRASPHPVVVGGGASGVELALSILSWRKKHHMAPNVTLISANYLLSKYAKNTSRKVEAIAKQKGLQYYTNEIVDHIEENTIITTKGRTLPHSKALWLTGAKTPDLFKESSLPYDRSGFLLTNDSLQSVKYPEIFGAGDCITIENFPSLAKNGVYAVRQGPVLWQNLKRFLSSDALLSFTPQKRFLTILSTGNDEGLLSYGNLSFHGSMAWKLKHSIDQRFMEQYIRLYQ